MGFFDFLFGEDDQGPQIVDTTANEFVGLRKPLADALNSFLTTGGGPTFKGPFTAGLTGPQKGILNRVTSLAGGPSDLQNQGRDVLGKTIRGDFLSPNSNPFLQDTIDAATQGTLRNFKEIQLPRLQGGFTAAGHTIQPGGSSPFDRAAALAQGDTLNTIANIATNIASQNFQNERTRQADAVRQAETITGQDIDRAIQALQANELPRMIEQLGIDRGLEEFRRQINTLLQAVGGASGLVQGQNVQVEGAKGQEGAIGSIFDLGLNTIPGSGVFKAITSLF